MTKAETEKTKKKITQKPNNRKICSDRTWIWNSKSSFSWRWICSSHIIHASYESIPANLDNDLADANTTTHTQNMYYTKHTLQNNIEWIGDRSKLKTDKVKETYLTYVDKKKQRRKKCNRNQRSMNIYIAHWFVSPPRGLSWFGFFDMATFSWVFRFVFRPYSRLCQA